MADKHMTHDDLVSLIKETAGAVVAERVEAALAKQNEQATQQITSLGEVISTRMSASTRPTTEAAKQAGLDMAGAVICLAYSKMQLGPAIDHAKKTNMGEGVAKALEASTAGPGGILVAPQYSSELIDLLTPRAVVRSFRPLTMPMDSGIMHVPRMTTGSTSSYIGENSQPAASQQAFDNVVLQAKKLGTLVPMSNDLLRRGGPMVQTIVRNDILRSQALKEDVTFLRSSGTQFTPKGLYYWAPAANKITANGTVNLANVTADLGALVLVLEEANVAFSNPGFVMAPRTKQYLLTVRDGNGNYAFRDEMLRGSLWGYPYRTTTQVPKNLGNGGDESEVYLADFDDIVIGQTMAVEVAISNEASYIDENSTLVSAFSKDQTVVRVLQEHDLASRHNESIAVLEGVTWSPS